MSAFTCWGLHAGTLQMLTSYFQYTLPVNLLLPSYSTLPRHWGKLCWKKYKLKAEFPNIQSVLRTRSLLLTAGHPNCFRKPEELFRSGIFTLLWVYLTLTSGLHMFEPASFRPSEWLEQEGTRQRTGPACEPQGCLRKKLKFSQIFCRS